MADQMEDLPPTVERLLWLLELERLDRDLFRGRSPVHRHNARLFGGQVAAQALRAATLTVDVDHHPNSLHGYFLRPGLPATPLLIHVDRIRDGRSFTTRRVKVVQDGEAIFSADASFHREEPGGEYQVPMALETPAPEDDDGYESPLRSFDSGSPFEMREVRPPPVDDAGVYESTRRLWVRTRGPLPDDRALHACVLTYVSDMGAVMAARAAIRIPWGRGMAASLDHAIWFHRPIRPDDWVLYDLRPLSNAGSRGLVLGALHARDGVHGASVAQEGLVRDA
jgi:acyl-CoA thioesterase-2